MNLGKETENLEFKKSTAEIKAAMNSISAILNKHGVGTLYFGVKPNGELCGQIVSESSMRDVSRTIYESIKPQIYPVIEEIVEEGKHLIKVEFNGEDTPYSSYGKYYLRTADEDREVTPNELRNFFIDNEYKEKWEIADSNIESSQIDRQTLSIFTRKAIDVGRIPDKEYEGIELLQRFGLTRNNHLNNAGLVLFGDNNPVTLKAALFATDEKLTFLDMKLYEGNICSLMKKAEEYILKNLNWRIEIIGIDRVEIPEIPIAVIREVIANSFAHAIYNGNTYHEICVHPSMITIYNPGSYASIYRPEEYVSENKPSYIRNAKLTKILYLNKTIEQFGSGFKRIDSLCKDAGIKYSYEMTEEGFTFKIYRNNKQKNVTDDVTDNVTAIQTINKTEEIVLELLRKHPEYTREQLADKTSKTVRTMQRVINSLRDKKLLDRVGSDKDGYWRIIDK